MGQHAVAPSGFRIELGDIAEWELIHRIEEVRPGIDVARCLFPEHERHLLHAKEPYLNVPFFLIRAAVYFAVWCGVALRLYLWSRALDKRWDPLIARKVQVFSGPGLLL